MSTSGAKRILVVDDNSPDGTGALAPPVTTATPVKLLVTMRRRPTSAC